MSLSRRGTDEVDAKRTEEAQPQPPATGDDEVGKTLTARQRQYRALCRLRLVGARLRALQAEIDVIRGGR